MTSYIPARGDLVWLIFDPQAGREQAGRRPAVVLSPQSYNRRVGLAIFCPVTSHRKDYPFEVVLPDELPIHGVVLSDQVKSLDWRVRQGAFAARLPDEVLGEILQKVATLLGPIG